MSRLKTFQELFRRERRPGYLVFAVIFLAFAGFLLANLNGQAAWVPRTKLAAQPAFWPTVSLIGMGIFAVLHLVGSLCSPRLSGRWAEAAIWLRSLEYVAYFLCYVVAVPYLGYLPSTLLFGLFMTARLGYRRWPAFAAAAAFSVAVVVVFRALLQVKVPAGQLYDHLPDALRGFALIYL